MWALLKKKPGGRSSSVEPDFLKLCEQNVRSTRDIVDGGNLLNRRQCVDLSTKLSKTIQNIREIVVYSAAPSVLFRPALESLYRHLEKARLLVSNCGEKDFCLAALFQNQNENAFREILLDVSLCCNTIYEQAKSTREDWDACPEDLRQSPVLRPAEDSVIHEDRQDFLRRLESIVRRDTTPSIFDHFLRGGREQHLARYLLLRLEQSQVDIDNLMMSSKESESSGTWGASRFIGAGAGSLGVVGTSWLGVPCAKKLYMEADQNFSLREAKILAHLNHPRVVKFFSCGNGSEVGGHFLAMELMPMDLSNLIERQRKKGVHFELPVAVNIMAQLARGICYLHDQGIAHRDVKPHNTVISTFPSPHLVDYFDVKLIDFGMSKAKVEASRSNSVSCIGVGTTYYRAPEIYPQANLQKANWFKADVFSFAITCSHVLSLEVSYKNLPPSLLYKELIRGARPELPERCPKEVVALLTSCWDSNPNRRPSFLEISTRLEEFCQKLLIGSSTLHTDEMSYKYISSKMREFSPIQRLCVAIPKDKAEVSFGKPEDSPDMFEDLFYKLEDSVDKPEDSVDKPEDSLDKPEDSLDKLEDSVNKLEESLNKPNNASRDQPEDGSGDQPEDGSGDQPDDGSGDEPDDGFEDKFKDSSKTFDKTREDLLKETQFYLNLSCLNLQIIINLVDGGSSLNTRQCQDLSFKLSTILQNVQALVLQCRGFTDLFLSPIKILYRYIEKAKLLVENCCIEDSCTTSNFQVRNLFCPGVNIVYQYLEKTRSYIDTWRKRNRYNHALCLAATFQIQNENAFSEILHEVSLCYKTIYEQAKSAGYQWTFQSVEDLCLSNDYFLPPSSNDVHKDQEDIKKRLEDIANPHFSSSLFSPYFTRTENHMQCLARYLLMKLNFVHDESLIKSLKASDVIFWTKETEPLNTWGSDKILRKGAGADGVVNTQWLGIPCVKKIFGHDYENYFYHEGGILIRLNHPHIVKFICCGNGQVLGDRFIAMECMEKSLGALIKAQKGPFPLFVALDIIVQIARGMRYIHGIGITHRDLKPDNVVVKRLTLQDLPDFFCVKLIDFGDSRAGIEASKSSNISTRGVGTTRYRAPEIHPKAYDGDLGKAIWFKADVYSFAMTCVHILSLKDPFHEMKPRELNEKLMYGALIDGKRPELSEDYPKKLTSLIKKCWHTNPRQRPHFQEICNVLEEILFKFPQELTMPDRKVELTSQVDGELKLKNSSTTNKYKIHDQVHDVLLHVEDIEVKEDDSWKKIHDERLTEFCNIDDEAKKAMFSKLLKMMLKDDKAKIQDSKVRTPASSSSNSRPQTVLSRKAKVTLSTLSEMDTIESLGIFNNHKKDVLGLIRE